MNKRDKVFEELLSLDARHGGLRVKHMEEFARDRDTAMHSHFTWNDKVAGLQWRYEEARTLVRSFCFVVEHKDGPIDLPVFVSDKQHGGYHLLEKVAKSKTLSAGLIEQWEIESEAYIKRWERLKIALPLLQRMKQTVAKSKRRRAS